jgi:hypothetical protein
MEDQQEDHGQNRLLLCCRETLLVGVLLSEQDSQDAKGSNSVAQCISLDCLPHISLGGPQVAGNQAEHSMQDTYMPIRERQEM